MEVKELGQLTVIALSGVLDIDASDQLTHAAHQAAHRELPIQIDMAHAQFIDSSAMSMFVRLVAAERRFGRDLVVTGASAGVRQAFKTAGLDRILTFNDT
ncbi:MAG: STAS domain-containing protein [Actinomycetales bacterium]